MPTEKRIDKIRRLCAEAGLNVTEVFREANVPHATIQNWDRKEPDAFKTYDTIIETINTLKKRKPAAV